MEPQDLFSSWQHPPDWQIVLLGLQQGSASLQAPSPGAVFRSPLWQHVPPSHQTPEAAGHAAPHSPQLAMSNSRSRQKPEQQAWEAHWDEAVHALPSGRFVGAAVVVVVVEVVVVGAVVVVGGGQATAVPLPHSPGGRQRELPLP